jgi:hypothetical protein
VAFAALVALVLGAVIVVPRLGPPGDDGAAAPTTDPGIGVLGGLTTPTASASPTASAAPPPSDSSTGVANPPPADTTRQANIGLLSSFSFGDFALNWLDILGRCLDNNDNIQQWQRDQGLRAMVVCQLLASTAAGGQYISFYRFEQASQARPYMVCQKPSGSPPAVDPTEVDLPGSTGSRAGWYCEYAANNAPTDPRGDIGLCWTDGSLPLGAEINWQQVPFAEGGTYLQQLRDTWQQYA